jgi:hypothetical protein
MNRITAFGASGSGVGSPQPLRQFDHNSFRYRVSESLLPASKNGHLNTDPFFTPLHGFIFYFFALELMHRALKIPKLSETFPLI